MKKTQRDNKIRSKLGLGVLLGSIALITGSGIFYITSYRQPVDTADMVIYKSPACGCCDAWIDYLEDNGYTVDVHNQRDPNRIKNELGVPTELRSCHTAVIEGYVIEGHVPATTIARLLRDKPDIRGLAVPGMPMGSPGMEGPRKDPYNVISFQKDGQRFVYERR